MTATADEQEEPCTGIATCRVCQEYRDKKYPQTPTVIKAGRLVFAEDVPR